MNQPKHTIQCSQNPVLSERIIASIQEYQKALEDYSVEYFTVVDPDSNYHSPFFATKAQSDAVLQSIRITCPDAYGEQHKVCFKSEYEAGRQFLLGRIVFAEEV